MLYSSLAALLTSDLVVAKKIREEIGSYIKQGEKEIQDTIISAGVDAFVCSLYVALTESSFIRDAKSSSGALGYFQMTRTALKESGCNEDITKLAYLDQFRYWYKYAKRMKYILINGAIEWAQICNYRPANYKFYKEPDLVCAVYSNSEEYFPYELDRNHDGVVTSEDYAVWIKRKADETWLKPYTILFNSMDDLEIKKQEKYSSINQQQDSSISVNNSNMITIAATKNIANMTIDSSVTAKNKTPHNLNTQNRSQNKTSINKNTDFKMDVESTTHRDIAKDAIIINDTALKDVRTSNSENNEKQNIKNVIMPETKDNITINDAAPKDVRTSNSENSEKQNIRNDVIPETYPSWAVHRDSYEMTDMSDIDLNGW